MVRYLYLLIHDYRWSYGWHKGKIQNVTLKFFIFLSESLPPLQLFVGGLMFFYVICVCFRIVVSNTYCVVFLFLFVLCTMCCQFLWIVLFNSPCQRRCEHLPSLGVRRLSSVNFSHFNLFLWNPLAKWTEASLEGPLVLIR